MAPEACPLKRANSCTENEGGKPEVKQTRKKSQTRPNLNLTLSYFLNHRLT